MSLYFPSCFATIAKIAKSGNFDDVGGFLVISRHASGVPIQGFPPHRFSGAGLNSIHEKVKICEIKAGGVLSRLAQEGFIRPPPDELRGQRHCRLEILRGDADFFLPHSFVDHNKKNTVSSPLARLKKANFESPRPAMTSLSDSEKRLDCLMVLLNVYRHSSMLQYGGLDPTCGRREWSVETCVPHAAGFRWASAPEQPAFSPSFIEECLAHCGNVAEERRNGHPRFHNAWAQIKALGLIYEAVTLFEGSTQKERGNAFYSIRINDFFASTNESSGDPSLLRRLEMEFGTTLGFYTQAETPGDGEESMRICLPQYCGSLVGVWRARFRPSTKDVGQWLDREKKNVDQAMREIAAAYQPD